MKPCVRCQTRERTQTDFLCDECRQTLHPLEDEVRKQCDTLPLLTSNDVPQLIEIARRLAAVVPTDDESRIAAECACEALSQYGQRVRALTSREFAAALPVRKAQIEPDPAKHRTWWRLLMESGAIVSCVAVEKRSVGSIQIARSKAAEMYCKGFLAAEIIPPDIDPENQGEEFQRNTANFQPAGLTVRQRTKKH